MNRSTRKPGYSGGWFRSLIGNAILSIGGGLALVGLFCIIFANDVLPWWVSLIIMALGGLLAWWGDDLRTRTIYVDPETGRVEKNNL